jgi:hypothetical protein
MLPPTECHHLWYKAAGPVMDHCYLTSHLIPQPSNPSVFRDSTVRGSIVPLTSDDRQLTSVFPTMRALRYYGPGDIRLEHDVPEPVCDAHQVKIRPNFCGICGSDLHAYHSPDALPFKDTPHPITGETWPITLGHEFSGDVVEIGARAQVPNGLQVGDRVAVQPTICCNQCIPCKEGLTNCCDSFGFVGLMGWGGGLSDYVCVDARFVFKLPETIPSDIGGKELRKHRSYEETC